MAFRKAKAEQAALKMGMYGPSGSGKTFTALLFAEGLAKTTGRRIAFVDTERGTDFYCKMVPERKVHPEAFDFDAIYTRSLTEVLKECRGLNDKEYCAIVIDSMTHLWEAARNAYAGKTTSIGTIPMQAWGQIKKPYKDLMNFLLSTSMHVFILGRQGNDYGEDEETGELKRLGFKMRAEGETPYEPHILLRMEAVKRGKGDPIITAFAEKDRTGVLQGKTLANPTFESVCKPLLPLLGVEQAQIASEDEVGTQDAEALADQERQRGEDSNRLLKSFSAQIDLCEDIGGLKTIGKGITPAVKKRMLPAHVTALREKYLNAESVLSGKGPRENGGPRPCGCPSDPDGIHAPDCPEIGAAA